MITTVALVYLSGSQNTFYLLQEEVYNKTENIKN